MYYKGILTFDLPVLNSHTEPVHFLGFLPPRFGSLHADPGGLFKCGSGSATLPESVHVSEDITSIVRVNLQIPCIICVDG